MKKGYQIVEPRWLSGLAVDRSKHRLLIIILNWLVERLGREISENGQRVELEVIKVTYVGSYPSLGIHYFNEPNPHDLEPMVVASVEKLLKECSVSDFIEFAANPDVNWDNVALKLMGQDLQGKGER